MKKFEQIQAKQLKIKTWEAKRKEAKLSVKDLAKIAKVSRTAIYYMLNGDTCNPAWRIVNAVEDALNQKLAINN